MKPEEAIETIKIAIAEVEWNYPMDYTVAFEEAIEALEKQIPKKPKFVTKKELYDFDRPFATIDVTTMVCPCCNSKIMFRKTIKYCLECGQRLDWEEIE